jgi:hypothetical protein
MSVTIDQILTLVGRLDDSPGYDAPRERYRRFLLDYVRDWPVARALIEECQFSPDEQHRFALQDLVAVLGQFLGFRVTLSPASWHARGRLNLILDVKSNPSAAPDVTSLAEAVASAARVIDAHASRCTGLCVLSPLYLYRDKVEQAASRASAPVSVVALRSLVSMADMVHAGRMDRQDVARVFESNLSIDFMVSLIGQPVPAAATEPRREAPAAVVEATEPQPPQPESDADDAQFWLAPVVPDYATRPEEFLERVVAKRLTFGVADVTAAGRAVQPADRLCFYIAGSGVVGHARVASLAGGTAGLRDAHRFRQILHLEGLELFLAAPVPADAETQLRLRTAQLSHGQRQTLVRISRESFMAMTTPSEPTARALG